MNKPVNVRTNLNANCLRQLARECTNSRQRRRMQAIAALLDGRSRTEAAAIGNMEWQTLRDWVYRFNAEGVEGLRDRQKSGGPYKLSEEQIAEFAELILKGPAPEGSRRRGWRRAELVALCWEQFGVRYSERTVSLWLHRLGLARLSICPGVRNQSHQRLHRSFAHSPGREANW